MLMAYRNFIIVSILTLSGLNSWAQIPPAFQNIGSAQAPANVEAIAVQAPERPFEPNVDFTEQDFTNKPWTKEFQFVIAVNKATEGSEKQTIRIYKNQRPVTLGDITAYLSQLTIQDTAELNALKAAANSSGRDLDKSIGLIQARLVDREMRIRELAQKMQSEGIFRVSTGRDQFEKKGEHHSNNDSWTITPTGFFTPQFFDIKHKSESYSNSLCNTAFGSLITLISKKQLCTYMENAVFFNGAIALHKAIPGTEGMLGQKASGGCVRMPAALAEFLFHNLDQAKGTLPQVNVDGTLKVDEQGHPIYSNKSTSVWGNLDSRSALIIVMNQVR